MARTSSSSTPAEPGTASTQPTARKAWLDRFSSLLKEGEQIMLLVDEDGNVPIIPLPPDITPLPPGTYIDPLIRTSADMMEYGSGLFSVPPDAPQRMRDMADQTRQTGELIDTLDPFIARLKGVYGTRRTQMCLLGGAVVGTVRGLDSAALLDPAKRKLIDQIKTPILNVLNTKDASVYQSKLYHDHLIAHGQQQVAAVKADLQVARAETAVLRGSALGKDTLIAPPTQAHKKGKAKKAPKKSG